MNFPLRASSSGSLPWLLAILLGCLVASDSLVAQRPSRDERDRTLRDFPAERDQFRSRDGMSRFRSPIEVVRFRTIDGTGNNLVGVFWGAAGGNLRRRVPNAYLDGLNIPAGLHRKTARSISNYMCNQNGQDIPNDRGLSSMVWQWGQFLDHDLSLTETHEPHETLPIIIPTGDRYFDPFQTGTQSMSFFRSEYRRGANGAREQINRITSWIDASQVYGSDDETASLLRDFTGGLLSVSEGDMLPIDEQTGFFLAGDVRANEQVCLTAMHTIFVREHNRKANQIANRYPFLTDEQIYVRAKRHVSGLMQVITFREFLPAVLGEGAISKYQGYNPTVFPNISNLFSTAAYRFGHTMLPTEVLRLSNDGSPAHESLSLSDAFFQPANLTSVGVDPYMKGLSVQMAQEIDTKVIGDLRNFLFGPPGAGGFDLPALNIQRGRDHGLADFNSIRTFYRFPTYGDFEEISSDQDTQVGLRLAYQSVDDIDAWVGLLSEDHAPGASVGPTLRRIMVQQFEMLRDSDRFWYQRDFSQSELSELESTTLADVIERNSGVRNLQRNVFFVRN